jgi:hypothetical protein
MRRDERRSSSLVDNISVSVFLLNIALLVALLYVLYEIAQMRAPDNENVAGLVYGSMHEMPRGVLDLGAGAARVVGARCHCCAAPLVCAPLACGGEPLAVEPRAMEAYARRENATIVRCHALVARLVPSSGWIDRAVGELARERH